MLGLRSGDTGAGLLRNHLLVLIATRLCQSGCSLSTTCHIAWSDDAVELFGLGTRARCCGACQCLFVSPRISRQARGTFSRPWADLLPHLT